MTKRSKPTALKPISRPTYTTFHRMHRRNAYNSSILDEQIDLSMRIATRIFEAGNQDPLRRLFLYSVEVNVWRNKLFKDILSTATSLKEYFDSLHGYPKDNILLDAVTNAVERSYAKWNEDIFINWYGETRSWHSENTTPLHKVMDDYNELMCRVMEWCDSTTGDQKIVFPLEPVAVTPPVPVPWLSTTLLPPTISAPLPVAIKAELAST